MTAIIRRRENSDPPHRRFPWSSRAWKQALYLAWGIPALLAVPLLLLPGFLLRPRWLLPVFILAAVFLTAPVTVPALTRIHRLRLRAVAGVEIPPQGTIPDRLSMQALATALRSRAIWRQFGYHLVAAPLLAGAAVAALGAWFSGVILSLVYVYVWLLPPDSFLRHGASTSPVSGLPPELGLQLDVFLTLGGIVLLFAAPWVTTAVSALDRKVAQALLGPSGLEELKHRVRHLTATRAGAVDAADADRRRLERDLHDGTQQRLVSLAINLGMARIETTTVEEAHHAITEAHSEAKAAITELRGLIRGLHPAILQDRGLDAALSGVAARMPIPVRVTVDLPRRPTPAIEAVAYFVISEALANIAKHAQASQAEIFVERVGDWLNVIVSDDGVGGADPAYGSGLVGLAKRTSAVDGTFEVSSPSGGPTLITANLPCAR
jgi:signal transduction histidine kinase